MYPSVYGLPGIRIFVLPFLLFGLVAFKPVGTHDAYSLGIWAIMVCLCSAIGFLLVSRVYGLFYHLRGRSANAEWKAWLEIAQQNAEWEKLPVLKIGSKAQACLSANLPTEGRSNSYTFQDAKQAMTFCSQHRKAIVRTLRNNFEVQSDDSSLAVGLLELNDGEALLLFRQVNSDCAIFFAIRHRRTGKVVDLITHKWALYVRARAAQEGRKKSDEAIAAGSLSQIVNALLSEESNARLGPKNQDRWRARPDWGTLGYWHLVDCCRRRLELDPSSGPPPPPSTAMSDSELNYYEEIVHDETVKEVHTQLSSSSTANPSTVAHMRSPLIPPKSSDFL